MGSISSAPHRDIFTGRHPGPKHGRAAHAKCYMKDTKIHHPRVLELGDPLDGCHSVAKQQAQPPTPTLDNEHLDFPGQWIRRLLNSGTLRSITESGASRGDGKKRNPTFTELAVFLVILSKVEGDRLVHVSQSEVKRLTGLSSATSVQRATQALEDIGAIRQHHGGAGRGKAYEVLDLPDLPLPPPSKRGRKKSKLRPSKPPAYISSDGHVLNSWLEALLDTFFDAMQFPHVPQVAYQALFPTWDGKHTVDFALAPQVLVEVWAPDIPGYAENRKLKEDRCRQLGVHLLGVGNAKQAIEAARAAKKLLGENWAGARLEELQRFQETARASGHCLSASYTARAIAERIAHLTVNPTDKPELPLDGGIFRHPKAIRRIEKVPENEMIYHQHVGVRCSLEFAEHRLSEVSCELRDAGKQLRNRRNTANLNVLQRTILNAQGLLWRIEHELENASEEISIQLDPPNPQAENARLEAAQKSRDEAMREDQRMRLAMRLLRRLEAAMQGKDDPYAESDARRAREARREKIRALVKEGFPELGEGEVINEEDAARYIEEALADAGAERLEDIL